MNNALAMPQDEAVALVETLNNVETKEIGKSTVFYGSDEEGYSYFVILPPIDDAIVIKSISNLQTFS